ncbi:MAG: NAD(P)H-quinone oxidoreductase [Pseudomonadota bacterium]
MTVTNDKTKNGYLEQSIPHLMRAIEISSFGGPEVLQLVQRNVPEPSSGEVLLRVTAAGVNRPDILQRQGLYPPPPGASDIPGLEVSGEIIKVGKGVSKLAIGDRVCAVLTGGGYAEYAVAHHGSCLPVPSNLTMAMAAGLPETFFTVWANVFDDAGLQADETLLVHGGTSGIGATAIALAKAFGSKVIATGSSDEKCNSILKLGADHALRYDDPEGERTWDQKVQDLGGVDVVLDMAGGDFFKRNIATLNSGGRHVSIAFLRGSIGELEIFPLMRKRLRISGSTMKTRDSTDKAKIAKSLIENVWPKLEEGLIKATLDTVMPFEKAAEAHRRMEAGQHTGKIVLEVEN